MPTSNGSRFARGAALTAAALAAWALYALLLSREPYPLVASLGIGAAVMFFAAAAPELALYALLAALPYSFRFIFAERTELQVPSEPIAAALVGAYLFDLLVMRARGKSAEPHPLRWPLIAFAASLALAATQSDRLFVSAKNAARSAAYIGLAFPMLALLRRPKTFRSAVRVLTAAGAAAALAMTFLLASRADQLAHTSAYRGSLFTDYTGYGAYLTVFLLPLLSLTLFDSGPRNRRPLRWVLLALFGGAMLFCWSRGAWASLLAGILFLLAQKSGLSARRKWVLIGTGAAMIAAAALIPAVRDAAAQRLFTVLDPSYASNRSRAAPLGLRA